MAAAEQEVAGLRCGAVLAVLGDYLDGELDAPTVARVEAHLRGCGACARFGGRYTATIRALRERLRAPPVDPDALPWLRDLSDD